MPNGNEAVDLDKIFCINAKKYKVHKLLLKAVAKAESSLNVYAYRFEPAFFENILKKTVEWKDQDPKIVSASYGLMQLMFTTAWQMGFRGAAADLYNPVINVELGAKLLRQLLDGIEAGTDHIRCIIWPYALALARYNGGFSNNPTVNGGLRNMDYVKRVCAYWEEMKKAGEKDACYD
jgi:soluble lytic murein transglycosylase-like protein